MNAGHLLMLWHLERYAIGCIITEEGGLTKAFKDEPGEKETPHQRILYAMSGMVLAGDFDLLANLRKVAEPDFFDEHSDSHYIAEALPLIGGDPKVVLSLYQDIILRLGNRFHKAHRQATKLLLEKHQIAFDTIHNLFSQWDAEYGLDSRPKSDIVCRIIARAFHWPMPRGKFIGWDFKPLPEGYMATERMGLMELAERVKEQVTG
jgi:hypothetical protein